MSGQRIENIYWTARYIERALVSLNVCQSYLGYGLEASAEKWSCCWERIKKGLRIFNRGPIQGELSSTLFFVLFDPDNPLSSLCSLFSARENAKILRDWLPLPLWEYLNSAYFLLSSTTASSCFQLSCYPLIKEVIEKILIMRQLQDYLFEEEPFLLWLKIGEYIEKVGNYAAFFFAYHPEENKDDPPYEEWEAFLNSFFIRDLLKKKIGMNELSYEKTALYILSSSLYPYSILSLLDKVLHCLGVLSQQWDIELPQIQTKELFSKVLEQAKNGITAERSKKIFLDIQIECNTIHQSLLSSLG
ncbi:alpha-E domain-containing protein [Methylacidiphilum caldifontis]|uniref:DUF403 domain-containing protein n=1 Tax=Methylacidiphilum caldifontis TaxID=2795386 RepID=A0A4Y8P8N3_9BACT|nr:alpha-E domain-containing protein [Methylacidiphilum caldifontis]TFE66989.1 hypothetical protein A7Q10_01680 [Methylacidiphilum caldifontis]